MEATSQDFFSSKEIGAITEALIEFQRVCPKIPKGCRGARGKYADLSTILDLVQPKLIESGLTVIQIPSGKFGLVTILAHKSGEYIGARYEMEPNAEVINKTTGEKAITPQGIGSTITYQRRYGIGAILNLNIDVDDDAELPKEPEQPKPSAKDLIAKNKAAAESKPANTTTAEVKSEGKETMLDIKNQLDRIEANRPQAELGATTTKLIHEGNGVTSQSDSDPCGDLMAQKIKTALGAWEQQTKGVTADFKAKLLASGRKKITDLTTAEANQLLASIETKSIVSFFENQLKKAS